MTTSALPKATLHWLALSSRVERHQLLIDKIKKVARETLRWDLSLAPTTPTTDPVSFVVGQARREAKTICVVSWDEYVHHYLEFQQTSCCLVVLKVSNRPGHHQVILTKRKADPVFIGRKISQAIIMDL